jgi:plastocyanin
VRRLHYLLVAVFAAALLGACSSSDGSSVTMSEDFRFEPREITVAPGQTITFANTSSQVHTVTAYEDEIPDGAEFFASGGFSSEEAARDDFTKGFIQPGDTYKLTLEVPGTYQYFCFPHESTDMKGTIVVEE